MAASGLQVLAVPGLTMPGATIITLDSRDYLLSERMARLTPPTQLPPTFRVLPDLAVMPVRDQGVAGMCVGFACAAARGVHALRQQAVGYPLSPQFLYERRANYPGDGMSPRDAMANLRAWGICPEQDCIANTTSMPDGDADQACVGSTPAVRAIEARAQPFRIDSYWQVQTADQARVALHDVGPLVISVPIYSANATPWVPVDGVTPNYHCMSVFGYDDKTATLLVRNSWGTDWGDGGYCHMPYSMMTFTYCSLMVPAAPVLPDPLAPPPALPALPAPPLPSASTLPVSTTPSVQPSTTPSTLPSATTTPSVQPSTTPSVQPSSSFSASAWGLVALTTTTTSPPPSPSPAGFTPGFTPGFTRGSSWQPSPPPAPPNPFARSNSTDDIVRVLGGSSITSRWIFALFVAVFGAAFVAAIVLGFVIAASHQSGVSPPAA